MKTLTIQNLGPIESANISFGDLTFFVGPQASGKSIVLQMVKLLEDKAYIRKILDQQGIPWPKAPNAVLDLVLGEDMGGIWSEKTQLKTEKPVEADFFVFKPGQTFKDAVESVFYIPAQRVMCFQNDWLRFFGSIEASAPFVLKNFSEQIRQYLDNTFTSKQGEVFPKSQYLKTPVRKVIDSAVYHGAQIEVDINGRKQLKQKIAGQKLPFMAWSAGQKEFMTLLLSFYMLCPPSRTSQKMGINTVIIEEPEMGLHPKAITGIILQIVDLMQRGYQVIVSTHSPVFLEFAWAFNFLKKHTSKDGLYKLFGLKKEASTNALFDGILDSKTVSTYFFDRKDGVVQVRDISGLEAGSEDIGVADWGGISSFASHAMDVVAVEASNS